MLIGQFCYALPNPNFYELTLTILSYSKWPNVSQPSICVIDQPEAAAQFQLAIKQMTYDYQIYAVAAKDFPKANCQVVYFATTLPQQQQALIQSYPSRPLLSLSINNPACEIGSAICLYQRKSSSSFKINLDALSKLRKSNA